MFNTPLECRNVRIRLFIGWLADAANGPFQRCNPSNTFERAVHGIDGFINGHAQHPYANMWRTINTYYDVNRWYELTDDEIAQLWNTAISTGIDNGDTHVSGMDVLAVKRRWDEYGWTRYEHKRNGRRAAAKMAALPIAVPQIPMKNTRIAIMLRN